MRIFTTLAIAALLTAGAVAQSNAGNFDSFDLGSVGASRQSQIEGSRVRNDAMNTNASVIAPARSTVKTAAPFERK